MSDAARDVIARAELVDFLVQYGARCRDCADENGFCPSTGIGCGQRMKAVEFILGAIEYGSKHGFAAGYRILGPGQLDDESLEAAAKVCEQCDGKPCGPAELWTEDQRQFYDAGQIDALRSSAAAIRQMKEAGK